jgi:ribosomal protein L29
MKKKDRQIIFQTDVIELKKQARELEKALAAGEVNRYTNQSKNVRERKNLRRKLAVIRTVIRQKELAHGN